MTTPGIATPFRSSATGASCAVPLTASIVGDELEILTTAARTVIVDVPLRPPLDAVMSTTPPPVPVTRPVCETVAILGSAVLQTTVRPGSGVPAASSTLADSCTVAGSMIEPLGGVTATTLTGTGDNVSVTT